MNEKNLKKILVFGAIENPINVKNIDTLSVVDIPMEAIKKNMETVVSDIVEILNEVKKKLGKCKIDHVDLSLGIAVDGSVGILGSGISAAANSGITIQIKLE